METELLRTAAQYGGLAGLAVGAFLLICRAIIAKNIFPRLARRESYNLLRLIVVGIWSISVLALILSVIPRTQTEAAENKGLKAPAEVKGDPTVANISDANVSFTAGKQPVVEKAVTAPTAPLRNRVQDRVFDERESLTQTKIVQTTTGDNSPAIAGIGGNVTIIEEPNR